MSETVTQPAKSAPAVFIVIFAVLITALVGQIIWASLQAENVKRISALSVDTAGQIVVGLENELITVGASGAVISRQPIAKAAADTHDVIVHDIAFDRHGNYVLADYANANIKKYDSHHHLLWAQGQRGTGPGEFWGPIKLALHPQTGQVYVTDTSGHKLHRFDNDGSWLQTMGSKGSVPGQFHFPNGIRTSPDGDLFIVNTNTRVIDRFTSDGKHRSRIDLQGYATGYSYPMFMAQDRHQGFYVLMGNNNLEQQRLYRFDAQGQLQLEFEPDRFPSDFVGPMVIDERVIIADRNQWQLLTFSRQGDYLGVLGDDNLTTLFDALRRQRQKSMQLKLIGQLALGTLALSLLPIYGWQKWRRARAEAAALTVSAPTDSASQKPSLPRPDISTRYKVIYFTGLFLPLFAIPSAVYNWMENELAIVSLLVILGIYMLLWGLTAGRKFLLRNHIAQKERLLHYLLSWHPQLLRDDEVIEAAVVVGGSVRWPKRRWLGPVAGSHILATDQRLLLLETNLIGFKLKSVWELSYEHIATLNITDVKRRFVSLMTFQTATLDIITSGQVRLCISAMRDELEPMLSIIQQQQGQTARDNNRAAPTGLELLFTVGRDRTQPRLPVDHMRQKTARRAAMLSAFYPGLGQLYNRSLWLGLLFLVIFSVELYGTLIGLNDWYRQYIEVSTLFLQKRIVVLIFIWLAAIFEAYFDLAKINRSLGGVDV